MITFSHTIKIKIMKKFVLIIALLALCLSCDKKDDRWGVECDAVYPAEFVIENKTDKEILVSNNHPNQGGAVSVVPGETEIMATGLYFTNQCENTELLKDLFDDDNDLVYEVPLDDLGFPFTMTISGKPAPDGIWIRKYWTFTPGYYSWTYTLVVTDELLASLVAAE
jgi:hypothetical protein